MNEMKKGQKILTGIIIFLVFMIFAVNMFNLYTIKKLSKEATKLNEIISKQDTNFVGTIQYIVKNNKIYLDDKEIAEGIKGKGKVFYEQDGTTTILLNGYNKCAVKTRDNDYPTIINEKCPDYQYLQGKVIKIRERKELYKYKGEYIYRGVDAKNYIVYDNEYWRIMAFTDEGIKIINEYTMGNISYDENSNNYTESNLYNYLNNEYGSIIREQFNSTWNIGSSNEKKIKNISASEKENTTVSKVGTLTLSDYLKTVDGRCKYKNKNISCFGTTYVQNKGELWLITPYKNSNNEVWYVDKDLNFKVDNVINKKDVIPVITLGKNYKITSGEGTKEDPYKLTILNE